MRRLAPLVLLLPLALAACGGGGSTASSSTSAPASDPTSASPSPSSTALDCTLTRTAMGDFSTAVEDLARGLGANDSMSAVAASDAMLYALDQLLPAVTAAGTAGAGFAAEAWAVASLVKTTAAAGTSIRDVAPKIAEAFKSTEYVDGAAAVRTAVDAKCPSASASSSPSSSP